MALNRAFPKMPPELIFVLSCAKYTETDKEKTNALMTPNIDWDRVLRLAITHRLFPLVYNTLNSLDKTSVPEYVIKTLQQHCIKNALKVVSITNEIVRIINQMGENEIQPLILKGSPLSVKINEDSVFRPTNDIDILVDPLEFARAEKVLEQMGYKRYSPDFSLTPWQQKAYFKRHHHFEYFHLKRAISVELHWRIRSFNIKRFPTSSNLSTQKINIAGCLVPVMDDEYWLLFLMVHGYKHMWSRLRWLYDIKEFMKINVDWDKIVIQADISELRPILHQTLILVNKLFDVAIPNRMEESVANDHKAWKLAYTVLGKLFTIENNLPSTKSPFKKDLLINLNYFNFTWENKVFSLFSLLKPSEREFKLISLPDILYPLYYIVKPFHWLWKRILKFGNCMVVDKQKSNK